MSVLLFYSRNTVMTLKHLITQDTLGNPDYESLPSTSGEIKSSTVPETNVQENLSIE